MVPTRRRGSSCINLILTLQVATSFGGLFSHLLGLMYETMLYQTNSRGWGERGGGGGWGSCGVVVRVLD